MEENTYNLDYIRIKRFCARQFSDLVFPLPHFVRRFTITSSTPHLSLYAAFSVPVSVVANAIAKLSICKTLLKGSWL